LKNTSFLGPCDVVELNDRVTESEPDDKTLGDRAASKNARLPVLDFGFDLGC
jgi:hypothetical protein